MIPMMNHPRNTAPIKIAHIIAIIGTIASVLIYNYVSLQKNSF